MVIEISAPILSQSTRRTLECPVLLALRAAGLEAHCVDYPSEVDSEGHKTSHTNRPASKLAYALLTYRGEAILQDLPARVSEVIVTYDRTGIMEPFAFELPDLCLS